jgi:hypothetical protein
MKRYESRYLNLCIFLIVTFGLTSCFVGGGSDTDEPTEGTVNNEVVEKVEEPITFTHLAAFCGKETFAIDAKTGRPEPQDPSKRLFRYVEKNFKNDKRVRRILVHYFLDYDYAVLKKSSLQYKPLGKTLLNILEKYGYGRDRGFKKSKNLANARSFVSKNKDFFAVDSSAETKIQRNKALHMKYLTKVTR